MNNREHRARKGDEIEWLLEPLESDPEHTFRRTYVSQQNLDSLREQIQIQRKRDQYTRRIKLAAIGLIACALFAGLYATHQDCVNSSAPAIACVD